MGGRMMRILEVNELLQELDVKYKTEAKEVAGLYKFYSSKLTGSLTKPGSEVMGFREHTLKMMSEMIKIVLKYVSE